MMLGMTEVVHPPLIVAVSGGVDSMVLLDMLVTSGRPLLVAHANHGIRPDSDDDEAFVAKLAASYGVSFVSTKLRLRPSTSEEAMRRARYAWLDELRAQYNAPAVATAHHQDDVLETIFINLLRGTGWRGLCSLRQSHTRLRPLLKMSKAEIIAYAITHNLAWQEDSSNQSFRYFRNRIRHDVLPRLTPSMRQRLVDLYHSQLDLRQRIDSEGRRLTVLYVDGPTIKRYPLIMADENVAFELIRTWLGEPLETSRQKDLLLFAKTAKPGAKWSFGHKRFIHADKQRLIVLSYRD